MTIKMDPTERIRVTEPSAVVIFGASGDLTERKLVPSLYLLEEDGLLPSDIRIFGVARSEMTTEEFVNHLEKGMAKYCRRLPATRELWNKFAGKITYISGSYDDPATYRKLSSEIKSYYKGLKSAGNCLYYLAIPPTLYATVIKMLGTQKMSRPKGKGWVRLIIEKPFGSDLKSARELNDLAHHHYDEDQIYRIDHYLGKETVQNLLTFRFANSIFEPVWNRNYVDHIQISVLENEGVGHRGGYYDHAGVLRDMFQNHLLQLLCLTAMDPPVILNAKELRDEKIKVLRAINPIRLEDGVGGQYTGYRKSPGVGEDSRTPTYFALKLFVNSWRWQGVPFYLRSGKNLRSKTSEIILQFKHVPHLLFRGTGEIEANILSLCIQPGEGMHLQVETKIPGAGMLTESVSMDFQYGDLYGEKALPDAYERLLLDAMKGDASLFSRSDEIERAWELVDPLISSWENSERGEVKSYEPGSDGPEEAEECLTRDGRAWLLACGDK
jgi:glucose-6-phosphate 1-dehydrogenase